MPFFESKKSFKDTCLLFLGRIGIGLGQIVCMRILTGLVEPSQIGQYYYILAIGGIVSAFLFQPLVFYTARTFHIWRNAGTTRNRLLSIVKLLLSFALVGCILFGVSWRFFNHIHDIRLLCFALVPIIMLMEAIFSISTSSINLLQKRGIFIALSNADIWGRALSVLLLLLLLGRNIEIVLWGQIFSQSLIAIIAAFILMRLVSDSRQTRKYEGMNWSEVWKFYWPVALMQILFWSQISGFRIPLRMNAGAFGLGIFSVSFGITVGFYTMFQAIFTQLYDPIFWKSIADNGCRNSDLNAYIRNHWPYLFLFTFWMIGISMSAIRVMAAERYSRYYYLIVLMSIGEMIRHSGMAFYNFTFALNKTKILILPGVFSFVLCLCGTYYLGQVVSPIAATIVSISASYLVSLFILGFFVRRSVVFKIPLLELSITLVFGALLCFILLVLGSLTHSGTTFGSSVVLAIGGLLFVLFSYSLHHTLSRIIHKDSSVDFASLTCEK